MAYLIIRDRATGAILSARRHAAETPNHWRVVDDLSRVFPGRAARSPIDACHPNATQVVVYVSDDRDGQGRVAAQFQEWAVDPLDEHLPSLTVPRR